MPLFSMSNDTLGLVKPEQFDKERQLQKLIETNLDTVFSCRYVASEFATGTVY